MVGASFTVAAAAIVLRSKKVITAVGNAQVSTAQSKFGGASVLFDGTGDALSTPNHADFNLNNTANFTVEFWYRPVVISDYPGFIGSQQAGTMNGWMVNLDPSANVNWIYGTNVITATSTGITTNNWYHIAVVRSNTTNLTIYVNGVSKYTSSSYSGSTTVSTDVLRIGAGQGISTNWDGGTYSINGYLDDVRISNSARYTAAFTPTTTPFVNDENTLLLVHANGTNASTFFDDDNGTGRSQLGMSAVGNAQISTAQSKINSSSSLFDGTGDYVTLGAGSVTDDLALTGNYWTMEYWARITSHVGQYQATVAIWNDQTGVGNVYYFSTNMYDTTRTMGVQYMHGSGTDSGAITFGTTLATGVWQHHAFVRNGNTLTAYLDGVSKGTHDMTGRTIDITGYNNSGTNTVPVTIGGMSTGQGSFNGYLDEIRISKIARYTGAFTPSTTPFVNDADTVLLVHADGTNASTVFLDDNSGVPTTAPSTAVLFDGVDDYYSATGITSSATDTYYATVAITFYYDGSNGDFEGMLNLRLGAADGNWGLVIGLAGGTKVRLIRVKNNGSDGGELYLDSAGDTPLITNGWNQVVFWHRGNNATASNSRCWVNGVQQTLFFGGTMTNTTLIYNWGHTTGQVWIGRHTTDMIGGTQPYFKGRYSQIYIYNNDTSAPDINKFWYYGSNRPRDLGTNGTATGLAQPLIYHYGNNDTFRTNNGTGFSSYTLTSSGGAGSSSGPNYA
jgi:hypothetical protein